MISKEILEKIIYYTDEEIDNLNGKNAIDKSIFINGEEIIDASKLLKENEKISIRKHARFREYPTHSHNYIELTYVYSGSLTHVVDDTEIVLNEGEFILYDQKVKHSVKFTDQDDIAFNIIILPEYIEYLSLLVESDDQISKFLFHSIFNYDNSDMYMVFKVSDNNTIRYMMERLIENLYSGSEFKNAINQLALGEVLLRLTENQERFFMQNNNEYDSNLMYQVTRYIRTNYVNANLNDLANDLNIPDYQLCKLIKKHSKKTFKELVQDERMHKAKQLLYSSKLPISEIMTMVGYENAIYFYKIFKKYYNLTPKEYRKSIEN